MRSLHTRSLPYLVIVVLVEFVFASKRRQGGRKPALQRTEDAGFAR